MRLVFAILLLAVISCQSPAKKEMISMPGAYKMISQSVKSATSDTTYTDVHQMKIFTGDYMMYANINSPDSVSSFGIGSYSNIADSITEKVLYRASDSTKDDTLRTYTLVLEKTPKGYKQIIPEMVMGDQHIKLTEEYESAGTAATSDVDGLWKLVNAFSITGKDTTPNMRTQYKAYYAGHCIWGNTYADSAKKIHTGIGYGKFEMNGSNKVKESMVASTYSAVRGHDFDIDIEMKGSNEFTQIMNNADGSKNVEVYQRVKK